MGNSRSTERAASGGGTASSAGVGDGGDAAGDCVVALSPEQAQAMAHDEAEANNARLDAQRAAAKRNKPNAADARRTASGSGAAMLAAAPPPKPKTWHKPPAAAVVTAAALATVEDDDLDVETLDAGNASLAVSGDQAKARKRSAAPAPAAAATTDSRLQSTAESNVAASSTDAAVAMPAPQPQAPPPSLLNPWTSSLFTRNFQDESRNAELFVQLSRERAAQQAAEAEQLLLARRKPGKGKSSIVVASTRDDRPDNAASSSTFQHRSTVETHELTLTPSPRRTPMEGDEEHGHAVPPQALHLADGDDDAAAEEDEQAAHNVGIAEEPDEEDEFD